ncbi:hypothetical protein TNCV_955061 [Trichonephila clavipes]|nr:hypothetical protein TNCV_955061 [Trichonephila clavipes]
MPIIEEFIEMHEQEQDIEELETSDPFQSGGRGSRVVQRFGAKVSSIEAKWICCFRTPFPCGGSNGFLLDAFLATEAVSPVCNQRVIRTWGSFIFMVATMLLDSSHDLSWLIVEVLGHRMGPFI